MGEKDITEKTLASYNDVFSDIVNGLILIMCLQIELHLFIQTRS